MVIDRLLQSFDSQMPQLINTIRQLQIADSAMLGLYLHIPFCQSLCSYCNFNRGLFDAELKDRYVSALEQEIEEAGDGREADTVFFGGGTPSLLDPGEVRELLSACRQAYDLSPDAEVTLETNPETVTAEKMSGFRAAGVNRISFGVQSFDDDELERLGRMHSAGRAVEAVRRRARRRVRQHQPRPDVLAAGPIVRRRGGAPSRAPPSCRPSTCRCTCSSSTRTPH